MSEVLVRFTDAVTGSDGETYVPQACGAPASDGTENWIGWIEFLSDSGAVRTGRETTQPNRDDLMYWAEGLTHAYLEGAMTRALGAKPPQLGARRVAAEPAFESPRDDQPARG